VNDQSNLSHLKYLAKQLAKAKHIPHSEALDAIAEELGHAHWNALTAAHKNGWCATQKDLGTAASLSDIAQPHAAPPNNETLQNDQMMHGVIDGHAYAVHVIDGETHMQGRGWTIFLDEPPSRPPIVRNRDRRIKANPINDPLFVEKALTIAKLWAEKARASRAVEWPRRCTVPDKIGRARSPLGGLASEWHCHSCDGVFSGMQMVANMWYCPNCSRTPLWIHTEAYGKWSS
jgi:hypothetical protein